MKISIIVAKSKNNVIGINNQMPWYLPDDLNYFKEKTLNRHIVMGRKTYESIGKKLKKRTVIVVTRDKNYSLDNCYVVNNIEQSTDIAKENGEEELFICGGEQIYNFFINIFANSIFIFFTLNYCSSINVHIIFHFSI